MAKDTMSKEELSFITFRYTTEFFYELYRALTDPELNYDPSLPINNKNNNPALILALAFRGRSTTKYLLESKLEDAEEYIRKNATLKTMVGAITERISFLEREVQEKMTINDMRRTVGQVTANLDYLFKKTKV